MKKVRNIAVIVLSVICVGILVFLLWNLRSTEESAQEIIPEVQPEPMSEQSVSDSDVSGNGAENSADPTELPETEESEPVETEDPVEQRAEELLAGMTLEEKVGQMFIARCPETDAASKVTQYHLGGYILFARDFTGKTKEEVTAAIQSYQNAAKVPVSAKMRTCGKRLLPLLRNCMRRADGILFGATHRKNVNYCRAWELI